MGQKLPIGIQSFEDLRNKGFKYVDKSAILYKLVTEGKYYFLSRPRRFGKSLLLSTIKAIFEGKRELFDGLAIAAKPDITWEKHPVLHLDLTEDYSNDSNAAKIDSLQSHARAERDGEAVRTERESKNQG